jgi:uncharacterized iron-regulated membrane protein
MALPLSQRDREYVNFVDNGDGTTSRLVQINGLGSLLEGLVFDAVEATYPSSVVEVYSYKQSGTLVATITVTYTNPSKNIFVSAVRT